MKRKRLGGRGLSLYIETGLHLRLNIVSILTCFISVLGRSNKYWFFMIH